jgi:hypothetical protein
MAFQLSFAQTAQGLVMARTCVSSQQDETSPMRFVACGKIAVRPQPPYGHLPGTNCS